MTTVRQRRRVNASEQSQNNHHQQEKFAKHDVKGLSGAALWKILTHITGGTIALCLGLFATYYVATLHENDLWFSSIKEVEREISFRTECGLYYSYYKQMLHAPSVKQGITDLIYDNKTESMRTINILERMNVYQEVFLALLYRILPFWKNIEPVYFYIYSLFGLQAVYVISLYISSWLLSGTWLSGLLAAMWYIVNRIDTTRVEFTIPLRENWALPFFALQIAGITYLLRTDLTAVGKRLTLLVVFISTFIFSLTWQFNQFVLLIQAMVLFALDCVDMIPSAKVTWLYLIQATCLLMVCVLQFFNTMILGSLLLSFILAAIIVRHLQKSLKNGGFLKRLWSLFAHIILVFCLTLLINKSIKKALNLQSDEHIFKFIQAKLGFGTTSSSNSKHVDKKKPHSMKPDLAYNLMHTILFGCLALSTMRMKYLWTSHMCVFASFGLFSTDIWGILLKTLRLYTPQRTNVIRYSLPVLVVIYILFKFWPRLSEELSELREFYDPDTVQLMNWIKSNTPNNAVFAGSMQLLAGVKLCTGRVLTNHPHYEDKTLRERTKQVYQIYAKRSPEDVHHILRSFGTDYVILEDSICYERRHGRGCRLRDLLDISNGHIMEGPGDNDPDLVPSPFPRFCDEIKKDLPTYSKHFTRVFKNKTFHVYRLSRKAVVK
ncbi:protein C-mannosyl-transferase DPY19L3 isoform 2-T3 [Discoglossus pictus]